MRDFYYILGLASTANESEVKSAYRKLSKKFHPDANGGDKFFEERFKEIQEAYETLSDKNKKQSYDYLFKNINPKSGDAEKIRKFEEETRLKFEKELAKRKEEARIKSERELANIKEELERKYQQDLKRKEAEIKNKYQTPEQKQKEAEEREKELAKEAEEREKEVAENKRREEEKRNKQEKERLEADLKKNTDTLSEKRKLLANYTKEFLEKKISLEREIEKLEEIISNTQNEIDKKDEVEQIKPVYKKVGLFRKIYFVYHHLLVNKQSFLSLVFVFTVIGVFYEAITISSLNYGNLFLKVEMFIIRVIFFGIIGMIIFFVFGKIFDVEKEEKNLHFYYKKRGRVVLRNLFRFRRKKRKT